VGQVPGEREEEGRGRSGERERYGVTRSVMCTMIAIYGKIKLLSVEIKSNPMELV
jgi:hypothetical protein